MQKFVINVRPSQQMSLTIVRVHRNNRELAHEATLTTVLLYAPRDEARHGYFASARLVEVLADPSTRHQLIFVLDEIEPFDTPIAPGEASIFGDSGGDDPTAAFHMYARAVRLIDPDHFDRIIGAAKPQSLYGFAQDESKSDIFPDLQERQRSTRDVTVRSQRLRIDALEHYGPACAVTRLQLGPVHWWNQEVNICHIVPVALGGMDKVYNVLPMLRSVHWAFDLGLFTIRPNREIVFRYDAPPELIWMFRGNRHAFFPSSPSARPRIESLEFHFTEVFGKAGS